MKSLLLLLLLLWQAAPEPAASPAPPSLRNFRYQRTLTLPDPTPARTCAILDPAIFPHAGPSLRDLRLFQGAREIPYAITLSEPQQPDSDTAQIRNLGLRNRNIVFDLEMPHRPYTDVVLNLAAHNFIASATVSGTRDPNYTHQTHLGEFTLFDLASQHLSRNTTLPLQETDLPYLHIELAVSSTPSTPTPTPQALLKMVQGVSVPPSREAQSLYTTALTSTAILQRGRQSIASFLLPERIPIERVSFDLLPTYKSSFSRDVYITDHPNTALAPLSHRQDDTVHHANPSLALSSTTPKLLLTASPGRRTAARIAPNNQLTTRFLHLSTSYQPSIFIANSAFAPPDTPSETLAGTISRIHLTQAGREIRQQQLSVPATLGSNMQSPATVQVAVQNGDDTPLPIAAVRLEMRQHKLCFEAPTASQPTSSLILFYGDPALPAPQYDYSRLWTPSPTLHTATLGPEQLNPAFRTPPDSRPFTERHPRLLWLVLLAVLAILALTAIHSSRNISH